MNKKHLGIKKLALMLVLSTTLSAIFTPNAHARLIFTTEEDGVYADAYQFDKDGTAATSVDLTFGTSSNAYLKFIIADNHFLFGQDVSLNGNELKNFRVVNASNPEAACSGSTKGQMYYDAEDNDLYFCNGESYISTSVVAAGAITGSMLNSAVAGDGLGWDGSNNLKVNVDNNTIIIIDDALRVGTGSITANEIGTGAVGSDEISTGAVGSDEIATDAVGSDEIAANAVGTSEIADNSVAFSDLAERNVAITIAPDYPNYTLYADGSNNSGTMESDYNDTDKRNFYKWSSKSVSLQDYDIIVQWQIPENFIGWQTSNQIQFDYKTTTTNVNDNVLDIAMFDTSGDTVSLTGNTGLKSSSGNTWVDDGNITITGGTWDPGKYCTLKIKMSAKSTNAAYAGAIKFNVKVK